MYACVQSFPPPSLSYLSLCVFIAEIDPDVNRGSDQDDVYRKYREGYMPLTFPTEENHPNEYVMIKFDPPQSKQQ